MGGEETNKIILVFAICQEKKEKKKEKKEKKNYYEEQ